MTKSENNHESKLKIQALVNFLSNSKYGDEIFQLQKSIKILSLKRQNNEFYVLEKIFYEGLVVTFKQQLFLK